MPPPPVAEPRETTTLPAMPDAHAITRALVDALDDPALVVTGSVVALANGEARQLLGDRIEGHDVRLAIRHPQALELILSHRSGETDAKGIVEFGRPWRLVIRSLGPGSALVRLIDRSDTVSAERMRVDFVANASHELRTPLSTILGYAETLADEGDLSAEQRGSFGHIIRDEAQRMLSIVEDLMSLSRIEAGRFIAPDETVSVSDIIDTAVANARDARRRGLCEIAVNLPAGLPPVRGDHGQLVQLFDNLVGNAILYGCDQPKAPIELQARAVRQHVAISITDHGPGIAREHLPRLTERFYRVDAGRSRESGGTGLGLAIVKHIVERHRGRLDIRSTVGAGTTVTVELPVAEA